MVILRSNNRSPSEGTSSSSSGILLSGIRRFRSWILLILLIAAIVVQQRNAPSTWFDVEDNDDSSPESESDLAAPQPPAASCLSAGAVRPYLSRSEAQQIVSEHFRNLRPGNPEFDVGRAVLHLLEEATKRGKLLLTLQIGGMDGKTQDPMYAAMVEKNERNVSLSHWMPIVVEPVAANVQVLKETYREHEAHRGLQCSHMAHWAVAYGSDVGPGNTCTFHRFNDSPDAPQQCQVRPDWQKKQVGTLSEQGSKNLFGKIYDLCIVKDKVQCGSIADLFASLGLDGALQHVSMLQIDIEGYEALVLPALFKETDERRIGMPPMVNYESKVVLGYDRHRKTQVLEDIRNAFRNRGFQVYESGRGVSGIGADDVALYGAKAPTDLNPVAWYKPPAANANAASTKVKR